MAETLRLNQQEVSRFIETLDRGAEPFRVRLTAALEEFIGTRPADPVTVLLVDALRGAQEELRLIRMKDTNAVYDPTIRVRIEVALAAYDAQEAANG